MDDIRLEKRTIQERLIIAKTLIETALSDLPTADLSEYCDKLWKAAYERGKAEARPKRGSWDVRYDEEYAEDGIVICSECGEIYANEGFYWYKAHYCPNCGCRMKEGEEDDRE